MFDRVLTSLNLNKLKDYLMLQEKQLQVNLVTELTSLSYGVSSSRDDNQNTLYIYATKEARLPALLVAHTDTVHDQPPREIYYDELDGVFMANDGLGADDRAGVYAIMELVRMHKCDVLFTSFEERGLLGAKRFIEDYKDNPGYHMLIELDAISDGMAIFYDNQAYDFQRYILNFDFEASTSRKTDISVIAPWWRVNAVNLSVGYDCNHKKYEQLNPQYLENTIRKVKAILTEPIPSFKYIAG